jgi:uncharacterized membrane protein
MTTPILLFLLRRFVTTLLIQDFRLRSLQQSQWPVAESVETIIFKYISLSNVLGRFGRMGTWVYYLCV